MSHFSRRRGRLGLQVRPVCFLLLLRHENHLFQIRTDGEAAELLVEVDLAVNIVVREVDAHFHPATAEDVDNFDLVALLVLGLEYLYPQVSPSGLKRRERVCN